MTPALEIVPPPASKEWWDQVVFDTARQRRAFRDAAIEAVEQYVSDHVDSETGAEEVPF